MMIPLFMRQSALLLIGVSLLPAQGALALPSPGSQANSPGASLNVTVQAPGLAQPLVVTAPGSLSTTYAWSPIPVTCGIGAITCYMGGGSLPYTASITGFPNQPLALLLTLRPAVPYPLPPAPHLMASVPTPFGTAHLDLSAAALAGGSTVVVFDGLGLNLNSSLPASTDGAGIFSIPPGTLQLGAGHLSGNPDLAFQALVADPTSPAGLTLSAAFTTAEHF